MAYSVANYNIAQAAGITNTDTSLQAWSKVADWINASFSDIVTAEVKQNSAASFAQYGYVLVMFNGTGQGVMCGSHSTSANYVKYIYYGVAYKTSDNQNEMLTPYTSRYTTDINKVNLLVAKSDSGFIFQFYEVNGNEFVDANMGICLNCTDSNGALRRVVICDFVDASINNRGLKKCVIRVADEAEERVKDTVKNLFSIDTSAGVKTLLTSFIIPYTDCIPSGAYRVYGNKPNARVVFEMNGSKYVTGWNYGDDANNAIALRLE